MPGVDDNPIDAGATTGAQLPPASETSPSCENSDEPGKSNLNPDQGDLLTPFWPQKSDKQVRRG